MSVHIIKHLIPVLSLQFPSSIMSPTAALITALTIINTISTTAASTSDISHVLRRGSTCGDPSLIANCGANYPSNWCCPANSNCLSLNNTAASAVICCPQGNSCTSIQPITCEVSFQDATQFPNASLHLSNLTLSLPACGSNCCPLGYSCADGGNLGFYCSMLDSTKAAPSSSVVPSRLPTSTSSVSPTSAVAANHTSTASKSSSPKSKGGAVAAGIITTLVIIAAIAFGVWWWMKRKDRRKKKISEPIYDPQRAARTDFLMAPQSSASRPSTSDSSRPLAPRKAEAPQRQTIWPTASAPTRPQMAHPSPSQYMWSTSPPENTASEPLGRTRPQRPPPPSRATNSDQDFGEGNSSGTYQLPSGRYQPNT
jgi:hypothetical protein